MTDQGWLVVLSVLVTIACALLTTLIISLAAWKKGIKEQIEKYCKENKDEHDDLWIRVNHHFHNGGGNVVIPTTVPKK